MKEYRKPIPMPDQDSFEFWEGCKRHRLLIQMCMDCKNYQFYPRAFCRQCMSENIHWTESSGRGVIHTFTVIRHHTNKDFAKEVPYVVAVVDLDEGIRMMSNVIGIDPGEVSVGMKVIVDFEDIDEEISLYKFRPFRE